MRLSCIQGDPGYDAYKVACRGRQHMHVWLDGQILKDVITADEREGFIERYKRNAEGGLVPRTDDPSLLETEIIRGQVKIAVETVQ